MKFRISAGYSFKDDGNLLLFCHSHHAKKAGTDTHKESTNTLIWTNDANHLTPPSPLPKTKHQRYKKVTKVNKNKNKNKFNPCH
jgi:hypothetical protein